MSTSSSFLRNALFGGALVALFGITSEARADGLATAPGRIAPTSRTSLSQEIAAFKAAQPAVRAKVRDVQGVKAEVYGKRQNPRPESSRELRALGKDALLPMLEALAFEASQTGLASKEREALKLGMISAVGHLKDSRSVPVLAAILEDQSMSNDDAFAAASALGMVCDAAAAKVLDAQAQSGSKVRTAALAGLGECRKLESSKTLAAALRGATDDTTRNAAIRALGTLGSSWAWAAMARTDKSAAQTGVKVRNEASDALIETYLSTPTVRSEAKLAILTVEAPTALERIRSAKKGQNAETVSGLEAIEKALEKAAARAR
jgi:hypothetical protein